MANILIVEPDTSFYQDFEQALQNHHLTRVTDSAGAIRHLAYHVPHLTILTLDLPGATSLVVLSFIRRLTKLKRTAFLLTTRDQTLVSDHDTTCLLKPVHPEILDATVNELLNPAPVHR